MEFIDWEWWTETRIENIRNLTLVAAAFIGLPLAIWRSWLAQKQTRLNEAGQNIDRYQKGAAMLGDARMSVRQAGIFGLAELVKKDPKNYYGVVQQLLCSFIRDRGAEQKGSREVGGQPSEGRAEEEASVTAADCETATIKLCELCREVGPAVYDKEHANDSEVRLFLQRLRLRPRSRKPIQNVPMRAIDMHAINLLEADLRGANLGGANLGGVNLFGANLTKANLTKANLREVNLAGADLTGADLFGANLTKANLRCTNLTSADLRETTLTGASLTGANLTEAILPNAILQKSQISVEQLERANDASGTWIEIHMEKEESDGDHNPNPSDGERS